MHATVDPASVMGPVAPAWGIGKKYTGTPALANSIAASVGPLACLSGEIEQ